MKLRFALLAVLAAPPALAQDLFLKSDVFLLAPRSNVRVRIFEGSFTKSESAVSRDRVRDLTLVTPESVRHPENISWKDAGKASEFAIGVGPPGTYVLGVSTKPRERLSKHAKALLQVGDFRGDVSRPLGYPAEIVPLANPYALGVGGELELLCLVDGRPATGVSLIAGSQPRNGKLASKTYHADAEGHVKVPILAAGQHFAKFISMVPAEESGVDYESKWATLTFEVR